MKILRDFVDGKNVFGLWGQGSKLAMKDKIVRHEPQYFIDQGVK